jgi:gamma-glutamylcyclotransferase (GGCT)/AIG2-like uncharacterized protein YtfP
MDNKDSFLLFVYGTLMRDGSRNRAIADQTFIREAVTKTGYQLLDLGSYPGLVRVEQDGRQISGELWEIHNSRMAMLDQIEGAPTLYRMEAVEIEGESRQVYSYFFKLRANAGNAPVLEDNRWVNKKN